MPNQKDDRRNAGRSLPVGGPKKLCNKAVVPQADAKLKGSRTAAGRKVYRQIQVGRKESR